MTGTWNYGIGPDWELKLTKTLFEITTTHIGNEPVRLDLMDQPVIFKTSQEEYLGKSGDDDGLN